MKSKIFSAVPPFWPGFLQNLSLFPFLLFCFWSFIPLQKASGQVIGNWNFNNVLSGTPGLFNTVGTADFSASVPIHSFNSGTEYFGENGWPAGAVNTAMYMEFSLSPNSGYQLDISSIVLTMRRSNTGSPAGSGPTSWALRSSQDGFTAVIASGTMTHTYASYTVTPGSAFVNIYSTIKFRLYGYNTTVSSGGNSRLVFDNIKVNGIGYLLPARLGLFTAAAAADKVNLSYTVYQTAINDHYFIERSTDGISFITLQAIEETSNAAEKNYAETDNSAMQTGADQLYYRLRMLSANGSVIWSPTVVIKIKNRPAPIKTYTRNQQLYINGVFSDAGTYQAMLCNTSGQVFSRFTFTASTGYNAFVINLGKPLPAGFIIQVSNQKGYNNATISVRQ